MTSIQEKIIKPKLELLELAKQLGSVSQAWGMSRTMLKSVSGGAADFIVMRPEPAGQPAPRFQGLDAFPRRPSARAAACRP